MEEFHTGMHPWLSAHMKSSSKWKLTGLLFESSTDPAVDVQLASCPFKHIIISLAWIRDHTKRGAQGQG